MKISSKERTGLRAMVEFARRYGKGPVALSQLKDAQDLSLPYLEQVVQGLRRSGLLGSVRGARGGYYLAREPSEITVSDVFCALEGQLINVDCTCTCTDDSSCCERESICATRAVWNSLQDCLSATLDGMTLADMIQATDQV